MLRLVQPWPDPYTINARSPFGWRQRHPITGKRTFHHGIDVAMPVGTRLTAPAPGTVVHKGNNGSGGVTLIIRHEGNMHTVYYHLRRPSPHAIGATVNTGDFIAESGNTGASTGPHLHFELRRSRKWGDTIDPAPHIVKPAPVVPEPAAPEPVAPEPAPIDELPEPIPVPRPEPVAPDRPKPPTRPQPPVYNRPLTADHMDRLARRWKNIAKPRGWFRG